MDRTACSFHQGHILERRVPGRLHIADNPGTTNTHGPAYRILELRVFHARVRTTPLRESHPACNIGPRILVPRAAETSCSPHGIPGRPLDANEKRLASRLPWSLGSVRSLLPIPSAARN